MLSLTLACVGRAKAGTERLMATKYVERARVAGRQLGFSIELCEFGESRAKRSQDRKAEEAQALRSFLGDRGAIYLFDETGLSVQSERFAATLRRARDDNLGSIAVVVGGPDGVDASIRETATQIFALGAMTWPHQLVRVMVAEQIYRAMTILAGHPYHRR